MLYQALQKKAKHIRSNIIKMLAEAGSGHPGGSLSSVEILALLYFKHLQHDPKNPTWPERDRFILSKGHACPVLYATLAEAGYFPEKELLTLRKLGSRLQGHPSFKAGLPGIETSTGSLGQGFSIAAGMAAGLKLDKKKSRVYVLLGDGESEEGIVWEAAMFAAAKKLHNLVAILDRNKLQIDGSTEEVSCVESPVLRWQSFCWNVLEVDGHSFAELDQAFEQAKQCTSAPTMIVAHTIKGKGVSFMENQVDWHGMAPSKEQAERAIREIETMKP